jgi:hypothetical protein
LLIKFAEVVERKVLLANVSRIKKRCHKNVHVGFPGCGIVVSAYRATILASTLDGPFAPQPNAAPWSLVQIKPVHLKPLE